MKKIIPVVLIITLSVMTGSLSAQKTSPEKVKTMSQRELIDLSGKWSFAMDPDSRGVGEKWYLVTLKDSISLPGTTDKNKKGEFNATKTQKDRLTRNFPYVGMAWYQKKISIPPSFAGKQITLMLERTKETMVWVNGNYLGTNNHLSVPHEYDLSEHLPPGEHILTIMVNNGLVSMNPLATIPFKLRIGHALSDNIQTNWNGIIGQIYLEAAPQARIENVEIYPECSEKRIKVALDLFCDPSHAGNAGIEMSAVSWNSTRNDRIPAGSYPVRLNSGDNKIELTLKMGEKPLLWSEFTPALYRLKVILRAGKSVDIREMDFGMRDFKTRGSQFVVNGIKTFLRGRHDAGVFPLTGYPPMDTESWIKVFRVSKSYGINHHRFHSWTPPRAAFEAADITGIYLQPELPVWSTIRTDDTPPMNDYLYREGVAIIEAYGNHPSFVMMSNGNEMAGDTAILSMWVQKFREQDPTRRLYAIGSNDFLGTRGVICGDYFTTCRTSRSTDTSFKTNVRLGFNYIDEYQGGMINALPPRTDRTYSEAIREITVPVIGHETGQFQIYPDFREIPLYTGVLRPDNLEIYRDLICKQNMQDQIPDFHKASGTFAALCYREEIETALRTPGFGGFQLLDLQDFPGQGTCLVGVIDVFGHSKSFITPEEFSRFCNSVVPMAMFEKFCWTTSEILKAEIVVANYSPSDTKNSIIRWSLTNGENGNRIKEGKWVTDLKQGEVNHAGSIQIDLSFLKKATRLILKLNIDRTPFANDYSVWIYPPPGEIFPEDVKVCKTIDKEMFDALSSGKNVLLFPDHNLVKTKSVGGQFSPDFWHYTPEIRKGSFDYSVSEGTLSLLTNPRHPLFYHFPTDMHSNWQWWSIIRNSRPYILDELNHGGYKPIIQMVDNMQRNHRLGLIFEFAAGKGKLLVCMSNLPAIQDQPEAAQLYKAILMYMQSNAFNPVYRLSTEELLELFNQPEK